MRMGHDHCSPEIEGQGHNPNPNPNRNADGVTSILNRGQFSSITIAFFFKQRGRSFFHCQRKSDVTGPAGKSVDVVYKITDDLGTSEPIID